MSVPAYMSTCVCIWNQLQLTITLNNRFKLVTVCSLLNLWKILLPICNLAIIMLHIMHAFKLTWLRMNMFPRNCLCCSICANKAYYQHYQADITTLVIMMNLTALNYVFYTNVQCMCIVHCFQIHHAVKSVAKAIISITH